MTTYEDASSVVVYTDGSCQKAEEHTLVGAGFMISYRRHCQRKHVNPKGMGDTHTINRAELSAIHQAILLIKEQELRGDVVVYTDSAFCIYVIRRYLYDPTSMRFHPHRELAAAVVAAIKSIIATEATITFCKVLSHTGILGNEVADVLAKEAATKSEALPDIIEEQVTGTGRDDLLWPLKEGKTLSNLTHAVTAACTTTIEPRFAGSYQSTMAAAWRNIAVDLDEVNEHLWKDRSITWSTLVQVMKYRWGCLWTAARAAQCKMPYMSRPVRFDAEGKALCPLCGKPDSGAHIMGECTHKDMKKLHISRHNKGVWLVQRALSYSSKLGSKAMFVDAGLLQQTHAEVVGSGADLATLVTMAPVPHPQPDQVYITKPDIVVLKEHTVDSIRSRQRDGEHFDEGDGIILIELGYGADTKASDKRKQKMEQHRQLREHLTSMGYNVESDEKHCVVLGHGATVYKHF